MRTNLPWEDAGQGWEGLEDTLTLVGWSRARRVVVLRRKITGEMLLTGKDALQEQFAVIEAGLPTARYEYAVLVTSTAHEVLALARQQLRVLAICFQPLSDRLPIVRQTMVDGVNQDAALMLNSLSLSTAPRRMW